MKPEAAISGLGGCWLVGGAVRDAEMGRVSPDIDIAVPAGRARKAAQSLAKSLCGSCFPLDEETGVYRVAGRKPYPLQIDVSDFQGADIEADLRRRDFTINAAAYPARAPFSLAPAEGGIRITGLDPAAVLDPLGARADIKKRLVNATGPDILKDDPLRLLRAFRAAAELDFSIAPKTVAMIKREHKLVSRSAGERIRDELLRLLAAKGAKKRLEQMDKAGLLAAVFPELEAQRKCAVVYYGKGGVLRHTLAVVDRAEYLLENAGAVFPEFRLPADAALLKLTALLHDIAKPATAKMIGGRLRFFLHEEKGARIAEEVLRRLKFSNAHTRLVCAAISGHLRPGHLASNAEITDRAVYRFFRDSGEAALTLLMLCWADYAAYLSYPALEKLLPQSSQTPPPLARKMPRTGPRKTLRHLQLVYHMLRLYFTQPQKIAPQKIIDGNTVMKTLGIGPGRAVGRALEELSLAQVDGKVKTIKDALEFIKKLNPAELLPPV
ncbi:MAG: HD domain-containing protein [Elusimicrobiales bacterium]